MSITEVRFYNYISLFHNICPETHYVASCSGAKVMH